MSEVGAEIRADKWLWAARFFKTRALARAAVMGGKVQLRGQRIKPGRGIKVGDHLTVNRGDEHFDITVTALSERRLAAPQASRMYHEDESSVLRRAAALELRKREKDARSDSPGRPNKRERRQIIGFLRDRH